MVTLVIITSLCSFRRACGQGRVFLPVIRPEPAKVNVLEDVNFLRTRVLGPFTVLEDRKLLSETCQWAPVIG